jgi:hypothetical protein
MSEYQYYEFLALDRPLSAMQIDEVRSFSTRADISSTRFVNEYHWGGFRGDPDLFVSKYFDVMVYFANWGTHRLLIGMPADEADAQAWRAYENDSTLDIRKAKHEQQGRIVIDFSSETEDYEDWESDDAGWMGSLSAIRAELLSGDLRPMYLAWLASLFIERSEETDDDEAGDAPPIPAGLGQLTAAQQALAEFLRVDEDILAAAAKHSPPIAPPSGEMKSWIAALPAEEKDRMLSDVATGSDPLVGVKLQRRFRASASGGGTSTSAAAPLSIGQLLQAAREIRDAREQLEREATARKRAQRLAEEARAREERLSRLEQKQEQAWTEVEQHVGSKQQKAYDEAVSILLDLRELAVRKQALDRFQSKVRALQETHRAKSTFIKRLDKSGLIVR